MKIGIISDIHDNLRHLNKAINYFNKEGIDLLIHCGDWVMPFTMRTFTSLECPIRAVLGNGDPDIQKFLYQLQNFKVLEKLDLKLASRFQDFEFDNVRFGVFHGDDENLTKCLIESQLFDVLCFGHTHKPLIEKSGKTTIINPGSLVGFMFETGNVPVTVALFDTKTKKAEIIDLKIEES